ncbi:hypothetical protein F4775DRAFT_569091 [Biscogniauxia sp. FL1348]|nr:hypothetical protein F4775DRAFT_569091 [Biscogniauxia sp. FL1348]
MRIARERGYRLAALTGTPPAMGIFRALGFRDMGRVKLYVWRWRTGGKGEEAQEEAKRGDVGCEWVQ